ncbi:predicted protein [Plenodomus lingam JN3]|uniref:Predicted protein n=1 Tax=Leptosphaeria maculans (strain JN3 / isolate v23.1.3 / race Av1-4-5-6-7-8) TaxID=985895 RepID=E4ZNK0_LEPMJ|nr:predicted protein [Plenodomus lingam JN3]CBX93059.1 predicted protein [Plenodomus lingam JN3]
MAWFSRACPLYDLAKHVRFVALVNRMANRISASEVAGTHDTVHVCRYGQASTSFWLVGGYRTQGPSCRRALTSPASLSSL